MDKIVFEIAHKAYKIGIKSDKIDKIETQIRKYLDLDKNIEVKELLLAFIQQSYELVKFDEDLIKLSNTIDKQLDE